MRNSQGKGFSIKSRGLCGLYFLFFLAPVFFLAACSEKTNTKSVDILRVAVLPDQSESLLRFKYQPLLDHIQSHTNIKTELLIPDSYEQLLQWFSEEKIDLAKFGGVTYVKARIKNNAFPLVMRDVDGRFRSVVLVRANNPANNLHDIKGYTLAFGSRLSTSGHFMPRYFFQQNNIIPESYFSDIKYSGAHDKTAEWVRDGKVEAGVSNSGIVNEMFLDGKLNKNMLKVIWRSPPFSDYVWAIQKNISKKQRAMIRDSFLHLDKDPEDKLLLTLLGANYFIPAGHDDFSNLEIIVKQMQRQGELQ